MKKLYASKNPNKRIHPSPLSFLPSALMALASVLSPDDQLVLSYLLTSHNQQQQQKIIKNQNQNQNQNQDQNHSPDLGCSCFSCYKSFWARWDSSPDRHVIHTILDAFEEEETLKYSKRKDGKGKSKKKMMKMKMKKEEEEEVAAVVVQEIDHAHHENEKTHDHDDDDGHDEKEEGDEKSSVRRFFGWVFGINN